jgi:hypothetical protein
VLTKEVENARVDLIGWQDRQDQEQRKQRIHAVAQLATEHVNTLLEFILSFTLGLVVVDPAVCIQRQCLPHRSPVGCRNDQYFFTALNDTGLRVG